MKESQLKETPDTALEGQRLDVWLYRTRFFKTRSLATKTIVKGKIRITRNGQTERTTKPHVKLRSGDRAVFVRGKTLIHVEMIDVATRRGPATEAQTLYRILPLDTKGLAHEL